jgi:tRNA(Ile)-lysidine synthase
LWIAPADYAPRGAQVGQLLKRLAAGKAATLAGCRFCPTPAGVLALREVARLGPPVGEGQLWDGRWKITGNLPPGAQVAALGRVGLAQCPAWRQTGLPAAALLASPAVWVQDRLIAAPLAGFQAQNCSAKLLLPLFDRNSAAISH